MTEIEQIIRDAIHADEEARRAFEEPSPCMLKRDAPPLIYKTKENALIEPTPPATTTDEVWWESLDALAEEAGAACGKLERRLNALSDEVGKLRDTILRMGGGSNNA